MRRGPGSYLRRRMVYFLLVTAVGGGVLLGLVVVSALHGVFPDGVAFRWSVVAYLFCALVWAAAYLICVGRGVGRWSMDSVIKGFEAEYYTGQILDYAIAAKGCGVAHGIMSMPGSVGDIDHLVVTPVRVFVVETKYGKVPKKFFPGVLSRLANNVKVVRKWVAAGTQVDGYLVLVHDDGVKLPKDYDCDGENIVACTQSWLTKRVRSDIGEVQVVENGVAKKVWELGRLDD